MKLVWYRTSLLLNGFIRVIMFFIGECLNFFGCQVSGSGQGLKK